MVTIGLIDRQYNLSNDCLLISTNEVSPCLKDMSGDMRPQCIAGVQTDIFINTLYHLSSILLFLANTGIYRGLG